METTTNPTTTAFQVGGTYQARSACDHECIWTFTVTKRTAKFVTLQEDNETMRVGVHVHNGAEYALPFGTYSLAPSINAARPAAA